MKKIILVGLLLYSFSSVAQNDPQKIIDEFFKLYVEKGANSAVDYIFTTNRWINESKDQIENVKFKLSSSVKQFGDYYGYSLITKKTLGTQLYLYTFLVRYDRQPIRFTMLFYKPNDQWRLQNFSFDDSIDEELKEAARAYKLKENLDH